VYESPAAREHAINTSPRLAELCSGSGGDEGGDYGYWCSFAAVSDPGIATIATDKALVAELVIFAVTPGGDLSPEIKTWIEGWVGRRAEPEGAVVGLVTRPSVPGEIACLKEIYLRHVAHRAGMDYLSNVPPVVPEPMPDSPESYVRRAGQITSVLDEILRSSWPPPTLPR
jgi:hypothetical protein